MPINSALSPLSQSTRCSYCNENLASGAIYCSKCSHYQKTWKNWIKHLGSFIAILGLSGSMFGFAWSNYASLQEERAKREREQESESNRAFDDVVLASLTEAAAAVESAIDNYNVTIVAHESNLRKAIVLSNPQDFGLACSVEPVGNCDIDIRDADGELQPLFPDGPAERALTLLRHVRTYFETLRAIVRSENASQLTKAVDTGTSRAIKIISFVHPEDIFPPALEFDIADGVAIKRWRALEDLMQFANPILLESATVISEDFSGQQSESIVRTHVRRVYEAANEFKADPTEARLDELKRNAQFYEAFLSGGPAEMVTKLAEAHSIILDRLYNDASYGDVLANLADLRERAQLLEESFKAVRVSKQGISTSSNSPPSPRHDGDSGDDSDAN